MASASASWGPTFMDAFRTAAGKPYEFNRNSWEAAIKAGYGGNQIKTAIQREFRDRPTGRPIAGPLLRSDYMKHYKGSGQQHDRGFMDYMGDSGNIGLRSYEAAKAGGFKPTEIKNLATKYGMFLPEGATAQYEKDIAVDKEASGYDQAAANMKQWQTDVADIMKSFTREAPTVPESTVLRGQAGQLRPKSSRLAGGGTNQFKRGYTPKRNMMNLGIQATHRDGNSLNIG